MDPENLFDIYRQKSNAKPMPPADVPQESYVLKRAVAKLSVGDNDFTITHALLNDLAQMFGFSEKLNAPPAFTEGNDDRSDAISLVKRALHIKERNLWRQYRSAAIQDFAARLMDRYKSRYHEIDDYITDAEGCGSTVSQEYRDERSAHRTLIEDIEETRDEALEANNW